jgi:uncharacterized repeat protein (TIGR03806 family)
MWWKPFAIAAVLGALQGAGCTQAPRAIDAAFVEPDAGHGGDDDAGRQAPHDAGSPDAAEPALSLPQRSDTTHCRLQGTRSEDLPRVELEAVELLLDDGTAARFDRALAITTAPDEPDALYVIEQQGRVQRVDGSSTPARVSTLLDIRARFETAAPDAAAGLRAAAFHPDFASNHLVFVHYIAQAPARSVIARFEIDPASMQALPGSERTVLEVARLDDRRPGGPILFDGSGMLLVALGDGGGDDAFTARSALLGAILRLDVRTAPDDASYAIPADNPFALDTPEERAPEIFAYGFADPASCHLDAADGQLYCVDRSAQFSELNAVRPGADYGWPEIDGPICARTGELCLNVREPSRASYRHFEDLCGALGAVPVGSPSVLEGAIAYADACGGTIQGLAVRGEHDRKRSTLGASLHPIAAMGRDAQGALLVIDAQGSLSRGSLAIDGEPGTFPERLSDTGCFEGDKLQTPAADLIPFQVRSPLWSDGTHKRRYMVIPRDAKIDAPVEGPWQFPIGTILVKEFALPRDDRDLESVPPIETRFMLLRTSGWEFHSYRWNDEGTDAVRVTKAVEVDFDVKRNGRERTQRYQFPDKDTCPVCHSVSPSRVLGPRTEQLNSELLYTDGTRNQLEVLAGLDLFQAAPTSSGVGALPRLPDPRDSSATIEQRARSYLHTNCAHCHQPGGYSSPDLRMDLRFELPLSQTNICDEEPVFFKGAQKLIAPGAPERSALWVRMRESGIDRMPPVATTETDQLGVVIMTRWIESLSACPD